jgi:8-oxo-dGTP pyrophosphatase MutT (NUDIX family)
MHNTQQREWFHGSDHVTKISSCTLRVGRNEWRYAEINSDAIDAHWRQTKQTNPNYFNGVIYLIDDVTIVDGALDASLLRTDFKSYLYWRTQNFPDAGVLDGFGSALIRTDDGCIMLGRQRQGHVNGGLAYAPAGFIDGQDVDANGVIHIERSALREAAEETGIEPDALTMDDGFYLTRSGTQLSIAVPLRAMMSSAEFVRRAEQHIAATIDSELDAVIPVANATDFQDLAMPRYMRALLNALFSAS